jgi:hypothetical protein
MGLGLGRRRSSLLVARWSTLVSLLAPLSRANLPTPQFSPVPSGAFCF